MSARKRSGFTLVELLVVLSIIAILISLVMAGVVMVRKKSQNATTKVEMEQLVAALELFKAKFSTYPPSQVKLAADKAQCDEDTRWFLGRIWPNLDYGQAFGPNGMNVGSGSVMLKGDQCLVLFLGGRHDAGTIQGFSTSKSNPFALAGDRDQPFFKFQPGRLFRRDATSPFCSYGDGFYGTTVVEGGQSKSCYAYFTQNRAGYVDDHCSTVLDSKGNFPMPFKDSKGFYLNRQGFQLMSPGQDTYWGKSRNWNLGSGLGDLAADPANRFSVDNVSNFAGCAVIGS